MKVINTIEKFDKFLLQKYVNRKCNVLESYYEVYLECINNLEPLKLIGYWGACEKSHTDDDDYKTIDRFKKFISQLKEKLDIDIEVEVVLSDMHAIANGFDENNIYSYFEEIKKLFNDQKEIKCWYLRSFWDKFNISEKILKENEITKNNWKNVELSEMLERQAIDFKRNKRNIVERAQYYYSMRRVESKLITECYSKSIFFSISSDRNKELFPDLPCLYLWATRRGNSKAPWL